MEDSSAFLYNLEYTLELFQRNDYNLRDVAITTVTNAAFLSLHLG